MGCCGEREKGTVSEQQKWDYIVCDKTSHHHAGRQIRTAEIGKIYPVGIDVVIFLAV